MNPENLDQFNKFGSFLAGLVDHEPLKHSVSFDPIAGEWLVRCGDVCAARAIWRHRQKLDHPSLRVLFGKQIFGVYNASDPSNSYGFDVEAALKDAQARAREMGITIEYQRLNYSALSVRELKALAKERKLPRYSSMTKLQLIAALS